MATENSNLIPPQKGEMTLQDIFKNVFKVFLFLKSRILILILCGALGAGVGFVIAKYKKTSYLATTTFVLEGEGDGGGKLGQYAGLASMAGIDVGGNGGGIFQGDNILELYRSRKMIESALLSSVIIDGKPQMLIDSYIAANTLKNLWNKKQETKDFKFINPIATGAKNLNLRVQDSLINEIVLDINNNYLKVTKPDTKLSIIKVDVTSKNESFAKNFNEEIVKTVNDFYIQTKTKKSMQSIHILQDKVDSVRNVLNGNINSSAAISDATPNLNPTRQSQRVVPLQRSTYNAETNKAIFSELIKNLELTKMSLLKEAPLIQVVDSPVYPLVKNRLGIVKSTIVGFIVALVISALFLIVKRVVKFQ
jgi:hypothetical protein